MNSFRSCFLFTLILSASVVGSETKVSKLESHEEPGKHDEHEEKGEHKEHEKEDDHGKHDEHEQEEENSKVGPGKGIVKADEKLGFILSNEALKNFEVKTIKLEGTGPWGVPLSARMLSKEEINIYRVRNGFIKRIDFSLMEKKGSLIKIKSSDLQSGDEVITNGVGFVRIAELTAYGGAPEGHSH